jgi:phage anti-repressor protein
MDNNILMKIEEKLLGGELVRTANARELHEKLQVSTYFTTWIQRRLCEAQAIEGQDFISLSNLEASGQTSKMIYVSANMCQHIAMLERTEIGRKVRQYFIDVEKKVKDIVLEQTLKEKAMRDFKVYKELGEIVQLPTSTIISEASKLVDRTYGTNFVEFISKSPLLDNVKESDEYLEPTELGKILGISAISLNKNLESLGLQDKTGNSWTPTAIGKKFCFVHQWSTRAKSGYNLKWNVREISNLLLNRNPTPRVVGDGG